jgi:hypothetical protein
VTSSMCVNGSQIVKEAIIMSRHKSEAVRFANSIVSQKKPDSFRKERTERWHVCPRLFSLVTSSIGSNLDLLYQHINHQLRGQCLSSFVFVIILWSRGIKSAGFGVVPRPNCKVPNCRVFWLLQY